MDFKFNLIPPKSTQEISKIEERDNSILYSFILIFAASLVFFVMSIIQNVFIKARIADQDKIISQNEKKIASYDSYKITNGKLILKSRVLEPILKTDIDPTKLIDTSEKLQKAIPNLNIENFKRETDGSFTFIIDVNDYGQVDTVLTTLKGFEEVDSLFVKQIVTKENSLALTVKLQIKQNG